MSGSTQSAVELTAAQAEASPAEADAPGSQAEAAAAQSVVPPPASPLRRLLPWVVSAAVITWLLWPYRTQEGRAILLDAFSRASPWTPVVAWCATVSIWLTDAYATARTFQRWGTQIGLRETCLVRGATALFDAINPALGQAVLTLVMHGRGIPLSRALVVIILMNVIFLVHIAVVSGVGMLAGGGAEDSIVPLVVGGALLLTTAYLVVVAIRPKALSRFSTADWLMKVGLSGHAQAFLYRLPNMAVLIGAQFLFMRCFGIELPIKAALLYLPTVMFIGGMPISVQGVGPGQVAAVAFFARYVDAEPAAAEATVIAAGLAGTMLITTGAAVVGLFCVATPTGRKSLAAMRARKF